MTQIKIDILENGMMNVVSEELSPPQILDNLKVASERIGNQMQANHILEQVIPYVGQAIESVTNPVKGERLLEAVKGKIKISYDQFLEFQKAIEEGTMKAIDESMVVEPTYMTEKAVGADCFASEDVVIPAGKVKAVMTGIKAKFNGEDEGLFPFIRSSIPKKKGLILANGVGVIEEDYYGNPDNDGNIGFMFWNMSDEDVVIQRFERIGQIVLLPILRFDNAGRAGMERGASGSTGK